MAKNLNWCNTIKEREGGRRERVNAEERRERRAKLTDLCLFFHTERVRGFTWFVLESSMRRERRKD